MRVKTPWIVALKESRETRVSDSPMPTTVQLDLTPKEIQDSSYKAVCDMIHFVDPLSCPIEHDEVVPVDQLTDARADSSIDQGPMASRYLPQCVWAYQVCAV